MTNPRTLSAPARLGLWPRLALTAAGLFAALYLGLALARLAYPYDLDFVEDGMLLQAWQFARGLPVYVAPNGDFAPNVYMPFYTWLGGRLLAVTGLSYAPVRALSLAATLGTAALLGWVARRESGLSWLGWASAGLYLGGYRLTGFWYELARVDSVHVALAVGGLAVGFYRGQTRRGQLAAAALLALAFFTKQTAVVFAGGLFVWLWLTTGRRALWFAVACAALTGLPYLALNAATGGWLEFHTVSIATAEPLDPGRLIHFLTADLLGGMGPLSGLGLAALALCLWPPTRWRNLKEQPWLFGLGAAALVSGLGRLPVGGNLNNLMPVYALLCLMPACFVRAARDSGMTIPRGMESLLAGLIVLQLALGVYNPLRALPTPAMQTAGDRLVTRLRAEAGPVLVLMHPYYAILAGHPAATQIIHLWYFHTYGGLPAPQDLVQKLRTHYYSAIVSDESLFETDPWTQSLITADYAPAETLAAPEAPPTLTGVLVRPMRVYRPKPTQ